MHTVMEINQLDITFNTFSSHATGSPSSRGELQRKKLFNTINVTQRMTFTDGT